MLYMALRHRISEIHELYVVDQEVETLGALRTMLLVYSEARLRSLGVAQ